MFRSHSSVLSLVALSLSLASACSSDDGDSAPTTGTGMLGDPGAVPPVTPPAAPPASVGDNDGVPPTSEPPSTETVNPVGMVDPGTAPDAPSAGTGTDPVEEPPAPLPPEPAPDLFVEDSGLDCTVGDLPANIAANTRLPNPFVKLDGTPVATRADWRCRRKEIRSMAERFVYGTKPARPESVTGNVTGAQISVNVTNQGNTGNFSAQVTLPTTGTAPFPAVFSVGGSDQAMFLSQGVAIISYNPLDIGEETGGGGSQQNRQNKQGVFYDVYGGNPNATGLLAAWAWGVSRYIDVIEASDGSVIDKNALAVMGCSRFGKAAFAIGALDERIALSVPFESGTAGVPLFRAVAQAEVGDNMQPSQSLPNAFGEQAWFGDAFGTFLNSANTLPIDTHEIIGMFAPRGLLILDNPFIGELTPRGAHAAALAGAEIYTALGAAENISYHSDTGSGTHCSIRTEYQEPLRQAIGKHLLKNAAAAGGAIQVSQTFATANPQDWIDWETPTLE